MTKSNEEEEKKQGTEQITDNPITKSDEQAPAQSSDQKKYSVTGGVAIFFAIVALILTLCNFQFNHKLQKKLLDENNHLTVEVNELKHNQTNSQEQMDAKADTIQKTQSTVQEKLDQLNKQVQIAMNQRLYQNQDWLLLKARYYLELAQINAHWTNDLNTAIALLQQADKLLEQLHSPKIFYIRQAIAKEIAQLKAIPTVDITGLLSKLDAAQTSVSTLSIQSTFDKNKSATETSTSNTTNNSTWRTGFNFLEKLVVIRRDNENIKPLMSPLFESILKESIRLNLQEAQWAVLNNNPDVYQLALKQATTNLNQTFNKTSQNTAALIKQLSELQQIKITQEKPIIELSLPLLNQLIDNNELFVNPVNHSGKGEN